ncbi:MAG: polysaccharide biosynthesis C-terminal domain-containing protein [Nitrososphaerota archaeon]
MNRFWNIVKSNLGTVKNISAIGIADLVGSAISSVLWFYLAFIMMPEEYGYIHYYIAIASIAASISLLGSENTLRVYLPKGVKIQSTLYIINIVTSVVTSLVLYLLYNKIELMILTLAFIVSNLAIAEIFGNRQFKRYSKFFIFQKILLVIFALSLYFIFGKNGVLYGLAFSFVPYLYQLYFGLRDSKINFVLIRERLSFFLTNFAYTFSGMARGQVDKLIIAPILGFDLLGNYSFALQVVAILMIFPNVIYKYTIPTDAGGKSTITVKKITVIISTVISIAAAAIVPFIISFFFPKYALATQAIVILSFHPIPATIALMLGSKFLGMEKNRIVLIGTIISLLVNIVGVIILGPILGIIGTSIAFVLSSTANCIYYIIMNNKMNSGKSTAVIN